MLIPSLIPAMGHHPFTKNIAGNTADVEPGMLFLSA